MVHDQDAGQADFPGPPALVGGVRGDLGVPFSRPLMLPWTFTLMRLSRSMISGANSGLYFRPSGAS